MLHTFRSINMFKIYLCMKIHTPTSNGSFPIASKPKACRCQRGCHVVVSH